MAADRMCLMRRLARCHKSLQPKAKVPRGKAGKRSDGPTTENEALLSEGSSRDSTASHSNSNPVSNPSSNPVLNPDSNLDTWPEAAVIGPLPGQQGQQVPVCLGEGRGWTREETFLRLQWPVAFTANVSETFDGTRQNCEAGVKSRVVSSLEGQVRGPIPHAHWPSDSKRAKVHSS